MALSAAKRKENSRKLQREKGLVLFSISDTWVTPAQKAELETGVAILIAKIISKPV